MNLIIEQALQLPKEEKLELYYALQKNLDEEPEENTLPKEQWKEDSKALKMIPQNLCLATSF